MTSTEKNIERAKQIVDSWPEWKKTFSLLNTNHPAKKNLKRKLLDSHNFNVANTK